jgi:hypothetical protein
MFWDIYYFIFYNYTYLQSILISLIDYHAFQSTIFLRIQKNKKKSAMVHFDWPITKKHSNPTPPSAAKKNMF